MSLMNMIGSDDKTAITAIHLTQMLARAEEIQKSIPLSGGMFVANNQSGLKQYAILCLAKTSEGEQAAKGTIPSDYLPDDNDRLAKFVYDKINDIVTSQSFANTIEQSNKLSGRGY